MKGFAQRNPLAVTLYFLAVSGIAMFTLHPVITLLSLCGALLLFLVRNGTKEGKSHLYFLALFLLLSLLNPLISHRGETVLFVLNHNPVTHEALLYGICAGANLLSVLYWLRSFSQIMTSDKLLYVFGKFSPKLSLVLSMSIRYVSLFRQQAAKIAGAQKALGLYRENTLIDRFLGGLRIFSVLLTWALENGIITADSMAARGYGCGKRTSYAIFRFSREDALLLSVTLLLLLLTCVGMITGALDFSFYPAVSAAPCSGISVGSLVSYGILAFLPVIFEAKEAIVWKYSLSKI